MSHLRVLFAQPALHGMASGCPYLPLCEPQVHLSSPLGLQSLIILQRAAHNTRGDGQVAVVAVEKQSSVLPRSAGAVRDRFRRLNVRDASGFPRECHCVRCEVCLGFVRWSGCCLMRFEMHAGRWRSSEDGSSRRTQCDKWHVISMKR